jgi:hypothetical protein
VTVKFSSAPNQKSFFPTPPEITYLKSYCHLIEFLLLLDRTKMINTNRIVLMGILKLVVLLKSLLAKGLVQLQLLSLVLVREKPMSSITLKAGITH